MIRIPETSREYIKVPLGSDQDPTNELVEVAFLDMDDHDRHDDPKEADYGTATWITEDGEHHIRALVGPDGDHPLSKGDYWMWVRISYNPEQVVRNVGRIMVV